MVRRALTWNSLHFPVIVDRTLHISERPNPALLPGDFRFSQTTQQHDVSATMASSSLIFSAKARRRHRPAGGWTLAGSLKLTIRLRGLSVVVLQHLAEPCPAPDSPDRTPCIYNLHRWWGHWRSILQRLVRSLGVIVHQILPQGAPESAEAQAGDLAQALSFYGPHPTFSERVQIWRIGRQLDGLDATGPVPSRLRKLSQNLVSWSWIRYRAPMRRNQPTSSIVTFRAICCM